MDGNIFSASKTAESFSQKELFCESLFKKGKQFWHLCTPGTNQEIIFSSKEEMIVGMNLLAITAIEFGITIYTECLMNNHIHIILSCDESTGYLFFRTFKQRLLRYIHSIGSEVGLNNFEVKQLIPIDNLEQLRQEIVYVNRNGYVANHNHNPFSYPWGSGCLYYNNLCRLWNGIPFNELPYEMKRKMIHGRNRKLDPKILVNDGMILPASYCSVREGEMFFRDNWHYFSMLTKNYEAYSLVAKRLSDTVLLTDEEVYPAVRDKCMELFNVKSPKNLNPQQKRELIIYMHNVLMSTNDQIRRIMAVDIREINELFPLSAK